MDRVSDGHRCAFVIRNKIMIFSEIVGYYRKYENENFALKLKRIS